MKLRFNLPQVFVRYFIEGVLIFLSVYAAFLLESKRSLAFEREVLIGRLEQLNRELWVDSLKYYNLYKPYDSTKGWSSEINLQDDIYYDSVALRFVKSENESLIDSVFSMWKGGRILDHWNENYIESYEKEFSNLTLIVQSTHLFQDEDFRGLLWSINDERDFYVKQNRSNMMLRENLKNEFEDKLPIFDDEISSGEKMEFVTSVLFINSLHQHLNNCRELLEFTQMRHRWAGEDRQQVKDEIAAQIELL